jgi:hypothetical protein
VLSRTVSSPAANHWWSVMRGVSVRRAGGVVVGRARAGSFSAVVGRNKKTEPKPKDSAPDDNEIIMPLNDDGSAQF